MKRAVYKITESDWKLAYGYLQRAMKREQVSTSHGYTQFLRVDCAERLQAWCDEYLPEKNWNRLKNSMRQIRKRGRDFKTAPKKSVDLSYTAWQLLSSVAKEEGCTLSEAIEKMEYAYSLHKFGAS